MLWTHDKVEYRLGRKGALTGRLSFHLSKVNGSISMVYMAHENA